MIKFDHIQIDKKLYENFNDDSLTIEYACPDCNTTLTTDVIEDAVSLKNFVHTIGLEQKSIFESGLARASYKLEEHLGKFIVYHNLAAYCKVFNCKECGNSLIVVFGWGEVQNGRSILYISGIWKMIH